MDSQNAQASNKEMKLDLINSFRDRDTILALANEIKHAAAGLKTPLHIMEVCGGHTHSIMKYGLKRLLPDSVGFIHGPGCPVCVMPKRRISQAYEIAKEPGVTLLTLGDMIKVPGHRGSLQIARAEGADVRFVYSPAEVLKVAKQNPSRRVVFFAIGFETTTPMTAAVLESAIKERLKNVFFHINHVLVPPPLRAILGASERRVNALIAPSHVSVIAGAKIYKEFVEMGLPLAVSGFEPVDIMESVLEIVRQAVCKKPRLAIQYKRVVSMEGNLHAQNLVARYFKARESFEWRGLGEIANSALKLRDEFSAFDAEREFERVLAALPEVRDNKACKCGEILRGVAKPTDCKLFGNPCNPQNPYGSCMVSSEGACAAYYKYGE